MPKTIPPMIDSTLALGSTGPQPLPTIQWLGCTFNYISQDSLSKCHCIMLPFIVHDFIWISWCLQPWDLYGSCLLTINCYFKCIPTRCHGYYLCQGICHCHCYDLFSFWVASVLQAVIKPQKDCGCGKMLGKCIIQVGTHLIGDIGISLRKAATGRKNENYMVNNVNSV